MQAFALAPANPAGQKSVSIPFADAKATGLLYNANARYRLCVRGRAQSAQKVERYSSMFLPQQIPAKSNQ